MYTLLDMLSTHKTDGSLNVGIREFRANVRRYLDDVATGGSIVITDRGRPIARLVGVDELTPGVQRLLDEGRLQMPTRTPTSPDTWPRARSRGSVADLVADQRR